MTIFYLCSFLFCSLYKLVGGGGLFASPPSEQPGWEGTSGEESHGPNRKAGVGSEFGSQACCSPPYASGTKSKLFQKLFGYIQTTSEASELCSGARVKPLLLHAVAGSSH